MARIFISYRREDTGGHAGRLCDRLTARFGSDRVFMDLQDIQPGQNFVTSIDETMATCDCGSLRNAVELRDERFDEDVAARPPPR